MKRILLTGSTSFLGSKFIELYGYKYNIFGIAKHDLSHPIDLLDFESLKKVFYSFSPEVIIHTAAIVDQDAEKVRMPNIESTKNIVELAKVTNTPIIFPSSESVYGGKEDVGEYSEKDPYKPRSVYGETKAESEKLIIESGLSYLIARCHRFVGFSRSYSKPKQFPDTIKSLTERREIHLDSKKLFRPCLINYISDVFDFHIENNLSKKILVNLGSEKAFTYYDFIVKVSDKLGLDSKLIFPDGDEKFWPQNSTLALNRIKEMGYPISSEDKLFDVLYSDFISSK